MGTGFVLIIWAIIGTFLAAIAGAFLALICFAIQEVRGQVRKRWILFFAVTPFVCGVYCFGAFILYGIWCEVFRGRDFGIGDGFYFPIANGYTFNSIDTFENPYLASGNGHQIHHGFQAIDAKPPLIFLRQTPNQFFLIDTATGTEKVFATEAELTMTAKESGAAEMHLRSPDEFYRGGRFNALDMVAAIVMYAPPVLGFVLLVLLFWRSLKSKPG